MVETPEQFRERYIATRPNVGEGAAAQLIRMIEERDAAIAHAAIAKAFKEVLRHWESTGVSHVQVCISAIASRHNITEAELSPPKVYGEPDIITYLHLFVADGGKYRVCTKDHAFVWHDKTAEWKPASEGSGPFFYANTANAIAAKLRADGNYPGGGK